MLPGWDVVEHDAGARPSRQPLVLRRDARDGSPAGEPLGECVVLLAEGAQLVRAELRRGALVVLLVVLLRRRDVPVYWFDSPAMTACVTPAPRSAASTRARMRRPAIVVASPGTAMRASWPMRKICTGLPPNPGDEKAFP